MMWKEDIEAAIKDNRKRIEYARNMKCGMFTNGPREYADILERQTGALLKMLPYAQSKPIFNRDKARGTWRW